MKKSGDWLVSFLEQEIARSGPEDEVELKWRLFQNDDGRNCNRRLWNRQQGIW